MRFASFLEVVVKKERFNILVELNKKSNLVGLLSDVAEYRIRRQIEVTDVRDLDREGPFRIIPEHQLIQGKEKPAVLTDDATTAPENDR